MKTTEPNVRKRLKVETAGSHKRLDDLMSSRGPFDSASNYQWYLSGMYELYRRCESSINWVETQAELPPREISLRNLIKRDLGTLGQAAPEMEMTDRELGAEHDVATKWAQAYVMEGSSVGASFMIRGAKQKLGDEIGCDFLTQLAADAKLRWPLFVTALAASEVDGDAAVAAACDVFDRACDIFQMHC